jgi:hypothetical protein
MTKQSIRRYCCVHKFYEGGVENDFIRLICPMKIYLDNFDQIDTLVTPKDQLHNRHYWYAYFCRVRQRKELRLTWPR